MYRINTTRKFERALRKLKRSGLFKSSVGDDLVEAVNTLAAGEIPNTSYRDHALAGSFIGHRECHIRGDLLLVYKKDEAALFIDLVDIGTHAQIFG